MLRRLFWPTVVSVSLPITAGGVWGLGLARALAESFPNSPTFALGPTLLVALVTAWCSWQWTKHETRNTKQSVVPLFLVGVYVFWPEVAPTVGWTLLSGSLLLSAGLSTAGAPVLLAFITLALYLRTLGPSVGQADTFEFQVVAPTLGVAHPTGYPLYILCAKLFSLLPVGGVAWRVNLTSAVFATAAVLMVYQLVRVMSARVGGQGDREAARRAAAGAAALALAFSHVFWSQAVVAEVYTLHNLFVALILWSLVTSHSSRFTFYVLFFTLGLSFSNHLTTALLLPAVGLALLLARPRVSLKSWLVAAGLFALGLSFYLYIYVRWPALHDGVWMSPGEFWRYVTGQQFGGALRLEAWRTDPTRYAIVGRLLREPFGWPGLALSVVGLAWLMLKRWRVALVTGVTFLAFAWYALSYYVPDVAVFLLPAHLVLAVWLGVGATFVLEIAETARKTTRLNSLVSISLLYLLPLSLIWTNLPRVDQSGERQAHVWGDAVLNLPIAPGAAILADSARIAPLYYLQRIEGRRPDLDLLVLADEAAYRAELEARLAAGQTVYLARFLPGLEGRYHLRSLGPLTEVGAAALNSPPPLDYVSDVHFGSIQWLGWSGPTRGPEGGLGFTLYWSARQPVAEVYHVRLRLVDATGQVWWQETGGHAANNYYPTPAWRPGEVVADYHEIPPLLTDPTLDVAGLAVQVGWFRPFSAEGLIADTGEAWVTLTRLGEVQALWKHNPAPARLVRARWDWRLLGVTLPGIASAGAPVELTLHWDATRATAAHRLELTWVDGAGNRTPVRVLEQWGRSRWSIQAPARGGDFKLWLQVIGVADQTLPARCGWLARPSDGCVLATLKVAEAGSAALANLDGKLLLLQADVGLSALRPGQSAPVTLRWQGLQPMDADYTVSVQLVGPDGQLYGQVDAWPVQGTLPTSQWSPGQTISDPYIVPLSPDAPPGQYRVGVAVYLLATQTRLPVRDATGQVVGDMVWVGELTVD